MRKNQIGLICNCGRYQIRENSEGSGTCAYAAPTHKPIQRGGGHVVRTPLKTHKAIGFLSNTGPIPLENHKATKPAFNVGLLSASQRNVGRPMMACSPHQLKNEQKIPCQR